MTGMLASVNSLAEAKLVLAEKVDIIDLKEPALGSLGALDIGLVKKIVASVNGQCPISATIGDLPMQPELVFNAVRAMAGTGVDYIKIGLFPSINQLQVIEKLALITKSADLVAVLFADTNPDYRLIEKLRAAGFCGVMLDTLNKSQGSLTRVMTKTEIERFVQHAKTKALICGLAGSLSLDEIPILLPYKSDYLGFRGALCDRQQRVGRINSQAVRIIKKTINEYYC